MLSPALISSSAILTTLSIGLILVSAGSAFLSAGAFSAAICTLDAFADLKAVERI